MLKKLSYITILISIFVCVHEARSQFNPRNNTTTFETKIDTIKVKETEVLTMQIYDQAYDKYLRKLQFKQRNWVKLKSGLQITQSSYTNWAAGGNNAFSGRAFFELEHKYTGPLFNMHNKAEARYGFQTTDGISRKNEDFFRINVAPNWRLSPHWELSALVDLRSQFTASFVPPADSILASSFFAPAYLNASVGIKYNNLSKTFEFYLAPLSGDMIMVLDRELADKGVFGEEGRQYISSFGNLIKISYKKEKMFNGLLSIDAKVESLWDYVRTPRLFGEVKVGLQFTSWLGANFHAQAIYDEQIKTPDVAAGGSNYFQFFQTVGFGLTYNFESKKHPAPPEAPRDNFKRKKKRR